LKSNKGLSTFRSLGADSTKISKFTQSTLAESHQILFPQEYGDKNKSSLYGGGKSAKFGEEKHMSFGMALQLLENK
jgi:hypothetical protein